MCLEVLHRQPDDVIKRESVGASGFHTLLTIEVMVGTIVDRLCTHRKSMGKDSNGSRVTEESEIIASCRAALEKLIYAR